LFFPYGVSTTAKTRYTQTVNENAYVIEAPMVGVVKNDLVVNVVDNNLIVSATPSNKNRWSADFKQTWILNEDADVNAINARLENGLLTLTIPRVRPVTRTVNVTIQ
jgi:HSP20 family molecular chaperone IbpA